MTSKIVDVDVDPRLYVDVDPRLDAIYPTLDAIYPPLVSDECLSSDDDYFSSVDLTPKSQENKDTGINTGAGVGNSNTTQTPLDLCIVVCCTILCSPG